MLCQLAVLILVVLFMVQLVVVKSSGTGGTYPKVCQPLNKTGDADKIYYCSINDFHKKGKRRWPLPQRNQNHTFPINATVFISFTFSHPVNVVTISSIGFLKGQNNISTTWQANWEGSTASWTLPHTTIMGYQDFEREVTLIHAKMTCSPCELRITVSVTKQEDRLTNPSFNVVSVLPKANLFELKPEGTIQPVKVGLSSPAIRTIDLNDFDDADEVHIKFDATKPIYEIMCSKLIVYTTPVNPLEVEGIPPIISLTYLSKADIILKRTMVKSNGTFYLHLYTLESDKLCGSDLGREEDKQKVVQLSVIISKCSLQGVGILVLVFLSLASTGLVLIHVCVLVKCARRIVEEVEPPTFPAVRMSSPCPSAMIDIIGNPSIEQRPPSQNGDNSPGPMCSALVNLGDDESHESELKSVPAKKSHDENEHISPLHESRSLVDLDDSQSSIIGKERPRSQEGSTVPLYVSTPSVSTEITHVETVFTDCTCILERLGLDEQGARLNEIDHLDGSNYNFLSLIFLVVVFMIPAIFQISQTYDEWREETGDGDLCYHNFRCAHSIGKLRAFNNILSNVIYVVCGLNFIVFTLIRYVSGLVKIGFGTASHCGLDVSLGVTTIFVGVFSAVYHVCPSSNFFHFDTTLMQVLVVLCMFKLFGLRHSLSNPHFAFLLAGFFVFCGVAATLGAGLSWIIIAVIHLLLLPIICLQIYYDGHMDFNMVAISSAFYSLKNVVVEEVRHGHYMPLFSHRLVLLFLWNILSFVFTVTVKWSTHTNMSMYLLSVLLTDFLMYLLYYIYNKVRCGERLSRWCVVYMLLSAILWTVSLCFFYMPTSDWTVSPAESRALNSECLIGGLWDSHDVWHMLSASALLFSLLTLATLDDCQVSLPRLKLSIF